MENDKFHKARSEAKQILTDELDQFLLELTKNRVKMETNEEDAKIAIWYVIERIVNAMERANDHVNEEMRKK